MNTAFRKGQHRSFFQSCRLKDFWGLKKLELPDRESNPGLPRDRRGYWPPYYWGLTCVSSFCTLDFESKLKSQIVSKIKMFTQQWNILRVFFVNLAIISLKMCWGGHDFLLLCSKNVNFKNTIRQKMTRLSYEVYCYCRMAAYSFTFGVFKTSTRYSSWNMQVKVILKLLLRFKSSSIWAFVLNYQFVDWFMGAVHSAQLRIRFIKVIHWDHWRAFNFTKPHVPELQENMGQNRCYKCGCRKIVWHQKNRMDCSSSSVKNVSYCYVP